MVKVAYFAFKSVHPGHLLWLYILNGEANVDLIYTERAILSNTIKKRYDVGISEGLKPTSLALLFKRLHRISSLYMIALSPAINTWKFLKLSKHVDGIITVSSLVKSIIQKSGYNGSLYMIHPSPPDLSRFLSIKPNLAKPNICFIGSPMYVKGFDRLPLLIKKVRNSIPQARLIVIGGELDVEGVISLGWIPREKIREALSECSICVHPTRFDAFPVSVLEAMAAGVIPVVTPTTGTAEIVAKVNPDLVVSFSKMPSKVVELLKSDLFDLSKRCKEVAIDHHRNVIREINSFLNEVYTNS